MFLYVFNEEDRLKMAKAGFQYICADAGSGAWVFAENAGEHSVPEGVAVYRCDRLNF